MTQDEFEAEWDQKIRRSYQIVAPSLDDPDWYRFVLRRVHLLSPEAQDFIADPKNFQMGEWIIEAVATYVLERAIGLDVV